MCLIFANKPNQKPNYVALENAWWNNPDGMGLLLWDNVTSQWIVEKHLEADIDIVIDRLEEFPTHAVHFRYATHGRVSIGNCHPFDIGGGWYLMHNGILPFTPSKSHKSDTWQLSQYLKKMNISQWDDTQLKAFLPILREASGGDRLLIAKSDGSLVRIGNWVEKSEGYYSNSGCLVTKVNAKWTPMVTDIPKVSEAESWNTWDYEYDPYVTGNHWLLGDK
jgi:predicted glutamine amidotransferase